MKEIEFDDIVITRNGVRVTWEFIGEGWDGDYNPYDHKDTPLLRFSCDKQAKNGEWEEIENGSYCTRCPVTTPKSSLVLFANAILEACELPSPKRRLEELSWLCPDDDWALKIKNKKKLTKSVKTIQ